MQRPDTSARYLLKRGVAWVISPLMRRILSQATRDTFDGIKIANIDGDEPLGQRFRRDTIDALALIKSHDPRRYHRIQRQIKYLANSRGFGFGSYNPFQKVCQVDYQRFVDRAGSGEREWHLWQYASIIVREATSGVIHSRRILYVPASRDRIERLRHTEQSRFAKRADTEERQWSESLVGEFDQHYWNKVWASTFWQKFGRMNARRRGAQRKTTDDAVVQNRK